MARTAVVILNYNGRKHLETFLPGVIQNSQDCQVIVADNHSTDDSIPFLKENFPTINIISLEENGGYSRGYNLALQQIEADYYVLLNSDVEVTKDWISPIISSMEENLEIGAVQPKIKSYLEKSKFEYAGAAGGYIDLLGYPFCRGRIFLHLEEDRGQYDDVREIFWATGACLFVRASAFHSLGGLDEDFFAHMEEIDLCWRLQNAGHKIFYNGKSTVYHLGGGTLPKTNPRKTFLNFRNGLSLLVKNMPQPLLLLILPLRIILDWAAGIKFMLFDSFEDGQAVFKAHFYFLISLSENIKKRKANQKQKEPLQNIYKGLIVFDYYFRKYRRFDQLRF
ncbi:MAG: glycosyltransferase family 2 protein [Candidatus Aminicenantes bacterium]|nr:glycosyltransferase family 2 protein [Candidatus Aminicenantes bacterium]